jgi:hypothetical protein
LDKAVGNQNYKIVKNRKMKMLLPKRKDSGGFLGL